MARNPIGKILEAGTIKKLRAGIKERIPGKGIILDAGSGFRGSWEYQGQKDIHAIDIIYGDDCTNLMYADDYFNMVVSSGVIQYVKEPEKLFSETHRVLKTKGLFMITTINRDSLLRRLGLIKRAVKGSEMQLFTIAEIKELLERHGFDLMQEWGADILPVSMSLSSDICFLARKR